MKYGFIGCGNMGSAVARAVCKGAGAGDVLLANRTPAKAEKLAGELGIDATTLAQIYMDCIQNVNEIWQALTTDFKRKEDSVEREE